MSFMDPDLRQELERAAEKARAEKAKTAQRQQEVMNAIAALRAIELWLPNWGNSSLVTELRGTCNTLNDLYVAVAVSQEGGAR